MSFCITTPLVIPSFAVTEKIFLMGFLGYNLGFTSSDVLLPMTAQRVVKSDGLST